MKIKCPRFQIDRGREWEENAVDVDLRIWPCSFICSIAHEISSNDDKNSSFQVRAFLKDEMLVKYTLEDKEWNNLSKFNISEIKQHEVFQKFDKHPESPFCAANCHDKQ